MTEPLIEGIAASAGIAEGPVFHINSNDDLKKFPKGAVLVAEKTDPSYTAAFFRAVAIVTETGGITSHAAIVSRELGIPCILGARAAREILAAGRRVIVNGKTGQVFPAD